jgi:outer membrane protein OmpA-like peptidoglycan-associated protein
MIRTSLLLTAVCICANVAYAQNPEPDKMIRVHGKVLSSKDSSTLSATIFYEKLPYYDDMGLSMSEPDGAYELSLVDGNKYNIKIENLSGFQPMVKEVVVAAQTADDTYEVDLFVDPIEAEELIRLDNLNFSRGSAEITESSYEALDKFIDYINTRPDVNIQLEGHTDFAGDADANMKLSQARVEAVAEYLTKNGVKKSRVTTKAFGGTQPLYQERTDEARAANRRVEVRLIRINK